MHSLFRRGTLDRYFVCETFPDYTLNEKGIGEIIENDEMEQLYERLKQQDHVREAVFFRFLYFTGMRFNEALGVHPGNLYEGEIEDRILAKHDAGHFGKEIDQYPLFEGIEKSTSTKKLRNAYKNCGLRYRSWHSCRHTRATMLIGETANTFLARLWLGHSSEKVLKRYVHIYEAVVRAAKKNTSSG